MAARVDSVVTAGGLGALLRGRIWGDASWALLGQVGSGLVLLLGTRLITELVSPAVYGQVALMVGVVALGVSIFAYPFVSAGMRLLPESLPKGQRSELERVLARLTRRSTALAMLLLASAGAMFGYFGDADPWLFAVAGLLLAVTVQRELGVHLLIAERRQRDASLWQTTDSILRPLLAIGWVLLAGAQAAWVLSGYVTASLLANLIRTLRKRANRREDSQVRPAIVRSLQKDVLIYAWPLVPMELLSWFNSLGDRYVIGYLMTPADVGVYAAAYTLINEAFNRSATVLLRTFQPVYFGHFSADQRRRAFQVLMLWLACVVTLGLGGVVALIFVQDWVARLLLAEAYHGGAVLMPIIGAGCALQAVGTVIAQPMHAMKRTHGLLGGRLCGAVTAAITIPLMVQWQGLMGAALAAPIYFGAEAFMLALIAKPWRARMQEAQQR